MAFPINYLQYLDLSIVLFKANVITVLRSLSCVSFLNQLTGLMIKENQMWFGFNFKNHGFTISCICNKLHIVYV